MKKILITVSALAVFLLSFTIYNFNVNNVKAATIGEKLASPETGWARYDDKAPEIKYEGDWYFYSNTSFYKGASSQTKDTSGKLKFNFKGTKIRIIAQIQKTRSNEEEIIIDGTSYTYSEYDSTKDIHTALVFESPELENKEHEVIIQKKNPEDTMILSIDAIDIYENGELLSPTVSVNSLKLNKELMELNVGASESLIATIEPNNATNKSITWTSSDPEIATVDDNGNVIAMKAGTVTITATTTDGSKLSAKSEVTVKDAEVDTNRGILRLVTTTGDIHEYDLAKTEIDKFISWLDTRDEGAGKPYYKFSLTVTTGNIDSRTEYIMYEEIVSFVIDEYN